MIFLITSCTTFKPQPIYDLKFGNKPRCRVQCYDLNNLEIFEDQSKCNRRVKRLPETLRDYYDVVDRGDDYLLVFVPGEYEVETCHRLTGFHLEDVAVEIKPKIIKNIQACEDKGDN